MQFLFGPSGFVWLVELGDQDDQDQQAGNDGEEKECAEVAWPVPEEGGGQQWADGRA